MLGCCELENAPVSGTQRGGAGTSDGYHLPKCDMCRGCVPAGPCVRNILKFSHGLEYAIPSVRPVQRTASLAHRVRDSNQSPSKIISDYESVTPGALAEP